MSEDWYYGHDHNKIGPFSQQQLKDLATSGELHPLDTVWKLGIEKGVEASRVKNLFVAPPAEIHDMVIAVDPLPIAVTASSVQEKKNSDAVVATVEKLVKPAPPAKKAKQSRAIALKGADIIGQDGTQAKYRMKCIECGHKDSSSHSLTMTTSRTFKMGFYCRKCKRKRDVVVQVYAG